MTKRMMVRMPPDVLEFLKHTAEQNGRSQGAEIVYALKCYVRWHQNKLAPKTATGRMRYGTGRRAGDTEGYGIGAE